MGLTFSSLTEPQHRPWFLLCCIYRLAMGSVLTTSSPHLLVPLCMWQRVITTASYGPPSVRFSITVCVRRHPFRATFGHVYHRSVSIALELALACPACCLWSTRTTWPTMWLATRKLNTEILGTHSIQLVGVWNWKHGLEAAR